MAVSLNYALTTGVETKIRFHLLATCVGLCWVFFLSGFVLLDFFGSGLFLSAFSLSGFFFVGFFVHWVFLGLLRFWSPRNISRYSSVSIFLGRYRSENQPLH